MIPKFLDTYHSDTFENIFQGIGVFFPFLFYSYTLTNLLTVLIFLNIRGLVRHDERGAFLIGNHHLLHHKYPNYNFGEYWIDTLCGTRYPNKKEYKYGLIYV
jgi:sterol desaturase/sphingolipid hydroxylase (fatty acid hydroxylase superfamily)